MSRQQSTQSINVIFYLHMEVFTQFKLSFCSSLYCLHELHVLQWLPMHTQWELFPMWWWWPLCQPCPFFLASSCMQHQDWLHQCRTCLCFHPQLWTGIGIYLNYRVVQVTTVVTCSLETKSGTNSVLANCHRGVVTVFLSINSFIYVTAPSTLEASRGQTLHLTHLAPVLQHSSLSDMWQEMLPYCAEATEQCL